MNRLLARMKNMSHLLPERLAALSDEAPSSAEISHLASCDVCARERATYETLRGLARIEQASIGEPLTQWERLAPALRDDGTIDTGEWRVARKPHRFQSIWLQAAAALLFALGGVAYGRYSADVPVVPGDVATNVADAPVSFGSVEDARAARARYEYLFQRASLYLAAHDTAEYVPSSPAAIRHRLATLDEVQSTVRQALAESPADPVINGYYLTTLGQREATLRQLNAVLPTGVQVDIY
jgi:hypothetical protein